ncbi:MAG: diacylglycerol kinase [Gammaproteobacteria bacterium]|nr:diacylglycerol kinase [Gammaproteobacteria bacterium]
MNVPDGERDALRKPGYKGLTRLRNACGWSLAGLISAWRFEEAFRVEVVLSAILVPLGLWLGEGGVEKALLLTSLLLVLAVELVNSSVESVVDRISNEHHVLSKRAKDIGSAAVFVALVNVAVVWGLVLAF